MPGAGLRSLRPGGPIDTLGAAGVLVGAGVAVGSGVLVGAGVAVGSGVAVGAGVAVGSGVLVGMGVAVGTGVLVGAGVAVALSTVTMVLADCAVRPCESWAMT